MNDKDKMFWGDTGLGFCVVAFAAIGFVEGRFVDHHPYSEADLNNAERASYALGAFDGEQSVKKEMRECQYKLEDFSIVQPSSLQLRTVK